MLRCAYNQERQCEVRKEGGRSARRCVMLSRGRSCKTGAIHNCCVMLCILLCGAHGAEAPKGDSCKAGLEMSSVVMESWMLHSVCCCASCGRRQYRGKTPARGAGFAVGRSRSGDASQWHLTQYLQDLMLQVAHLGCNVRLQHQWQANSSVRSLSTMQSMV